MTGPDEYTGVVDDSTFTNLMAARTLRWAVAATVHAPQLTSALGVTNDETAAWTHAAQSVYVPWDSVLQVHPACENFTTYGEWDFEHGPRQQIQASAHYAKLYRRQVVKQADLVQALWWCADEFTEEEIARDFDYYEARTVRDSSLSAGVQGVIAARTGHLDLAYAYLRTAALVDMRDLQGDTAKGLHMASLAGAWHTLVAGIGGLDEEADVLTLAPRLPARLTRVSFRLRWRGTVVAVEVTPSGTRLSLPQFDGTGGGAGKSHLEVRVDDERHTLTTAAPVVVPLRVIQPLLDPPVQPPTREPAI